jgi:hypothetical protein
MDRTVQRAFGHFAGSTPRLAHDHRRYKIIL